MCLQRSRSGARRVIVGTAVALFAGTLLAAGGGQPPPGRGPGGGQGMGMMGDPAHRADMQLFHALLDHRDKVRRSVTMRPDGVETLTESDDPAVVKNIQAHVDAMYARVKEGRPIHQRDPLFRAVFDHASQITMRHERTPQGVKVVETSTDAYVVKLIQAHAEVVNLFVKNGRAEMMKNHDVPARGR